MGRSKYLVLKEGSLDLFYTPLMRAKIWTAHFSWSSFWTFSSLVKQNCTHFKTVMRRYATSLLTVLGKLVLTLFMNRMQPLHNICLRWLYFLQISKMILSWNMNVCFHYLNVQKTSSYFICNSKGNTWPSATTRQCPNHATCFAFRSCRSRRKARGDSHLLSGLGCDLST